jgi:hypothetical protein
MEEVGKHLEMFHLHCETATLSLSSSSPSLSAEDLSNLAHSYRSLLLSHSFISSASSGRDDSSQSQQDLPLQTQQQQEGEMLVWKEIITSCTKKLISLLRSSSSLSVNSLLVSYRKQLKSSITLSSSPMEPNQRYFQALYDLLGSWGALIESIRHPFSETSNEILYGWLVLFHRRILEASLESYEEFKSNKKLNQWLTKHSEITMTAAPGTETLPSPLNSF